MPALYVHCLAEQLLFLRTRYSYAHARRGLHPAVAGPTAALTPQCAAHSRYQLTAGPPACVSPPMACAGTLVTTPCLDGIVQHGIIIVVHGALSEKPATRTVAALLASVQQQSVVARVFLSGGWLVGRCSLTHEAHLLQLLLVGAKA